MTTHRPTPDEIEKWRQLFDTWEITRADIFSTSIAAGRSLLAEVDHLVGEQVKILARLGARPGVSLEAAVVALLQDRDNCAKERDEYEKKLAGVLVARNSAWAKFGVWTVPKACPTASVYDGPPVKLLFPVKGVEGGWQGVTPSNQKDVVHCLYRQLATSEDAAKFEAELARVVGSPRPTDHHAWAMPGVWAVHCANGAAVRLVECPDTNDDLVWRGVGTDGTKQYLAVLLGYYRPATPEEARQFEAEASKNTGKTEAYDPEIGRVADITPSSKPDGVRIHQSKWEREGFGFFSGSNAAEPEKPVSSEEELDRVKETLKTVQLARDACAASRNTVIEMWEAEKLRANEAELTLARLMNLAQIVVNNSWAYAGDRCRPEDRFLPSDAQELNEALQAIPLEVGKRVEIQKRKWQAEALSNAAADLTQNDDHPIRGVDAPSVSNWLLERASSIIKQGK